MQSQAPILTSIQGTNIWSGANVQQFNSLAVSWSIAKDMFSVGARYQWVTLSFLLGFAVPIPFWLAYRFWRKKFFAYINLSIILWYMGWLVTGINASCLTYFILGFASQWWLRKYHPHLFNKYNYIVSAALDGGTQVCVFILTFAVFGDGGPSHPFPYVPHPSIRLLPCKSFLLTSSIRIWAGNPDTTIHNLDYCMVNAANNG